MPEVIKKVDPLPRSEMPFMDEHILGQTVTDGGNAFRGRPHHDKSNSSDSDRQFQREGQPYDERDFWPDGDEGYTDFYRVHAKHLHAVGNVGEDEVPFFSAWFDETLDDGTRARCVRIMSEDGTTELFKVCTYQDAFGNVTNEVLIDGTDMLDFITQVKAILNI